MKYDLEIVSHAYAMAHHVYRAHLQYQLASLFYFAPSQYKVCYSVCYTPADIEVVQYLREAKPHLPSHLTLNPVPMNPGALFRRAVGRNVRALMGEANVYWFADVDYCFGHRCLETLIEKTNVTTGLVYPGNLWINQDHATGDQLCEPDKVEKLFPVLPTGGFMFHKQKRCIGGIHVIGRDRLMAINPGNGKPYGYINGHSRCQPVDPSEGFRQCRCDIPFKSAHSPAVTIDIPNVFRIRHTEAGRCMDATGKRIVEMKGNHD